MATSGDLQQDSRRFKKDLLVQAYGNLCRLCNGKPDHRLLVLQYNLVKRLRQELIEEINEAETLNEEWELYMAVQNPDFNKMASLDEDLGELILAPDLIDEIRMLSGEED